LKITDRVAVLMGRVRVGRAGSGAVLAALLIAVALTTGEATAKVTLDDRVASLEAAVVALQATVAN
jgi:hypothetical protein